MYVLTEKGAALVFGATDKELIAALVPAAMLERALPAIIGTELPGRSLRDARVLPDFLAKHHFVAATAGFADMRRAFEALSGHGKGQFDQLDAMFNGTMSEACQDDLGRIAATFPRLVFGYSQLDTHGFVGSLGVETSRSVTAGLAKLHAPMPAMPLKAHPLFALGAAVNVDAAFTWMKDTAAALRAAPFRCDRLLWFNKAVDALASKLDQPLPPMVYGLRGFELVVDDATVLPPSGNAHLLVAGDHIADLIRQLAAKNPLLATFALRTDGSALEIPLSVLGVRRRSSPRTSRCGPRGRWSRSATTAPARERSGLGARRKGAADLDGDRHPEAAPGDSERS